MDASNIGVGAVLSQRAADDKLHPCVFFSKKLSPAERHYDVGNRELLAVKLALEEWGHWTERTESPITVWTDHKNLAYIQGAKCLNSRQAWWALFFDRFKFNLTYRPGSKNVKPDVLSRQFHDNSDNTPVPNTILPASCLIGSLTREIESLVRTALLTDPDPGGVPRVVCLYLSLSILRSSSGVTHPSLPATLDPSAPCHCSSAISGGLRWLRIPVSTSKLVPFVPEERQHTDHLLASSVRSQCPAALGHTSPWTSSLDCRYHKVITPF